MERISKKFFKIPSYKSKKFSQLISEGVKKQPFSLPTYWGDFSRVPWKLNRRLQRICFRQVPPRLPDNSGLPQNRRFCGKRSSSETNELSHECGSEWYETCCDESAPKKRYAVVRLRGRNDADERQQAKTTAEMRTKNRYHKLRGWITKMCSEQLEFTHEICGSDWQSLMFCV